MDKENLVIFDIDGVVADFEGQMDSELHRVFGKLAAADRSLYRFEDRYPSNLAIVSYALELSDNPNFYYALPPISEALDLCFMFQDRGYFPWFVTSRPAYCENFTRRWLKKRLGTDEFTLSCGIKDKASYLKPLKGETRLVIIEDSPQQKTELEQVGFDVLIWSQPWNERLFPRLYARNDGTVMLWEDESEEAVPFFETLEEAQ